MGKSAIPSTVVCVPNVKGSLNTKFGQRAAQAAGADFTVQTRTSQTFSPGTDSDYITIVKDKEQIGRMQSDYNRRVNEFLTENGAIDQPRSDWQKKLDTDFMADPAHVSEAEHFDIPQPDQQVFISWFRRDIHQ